MAMDVDNNRKEGAMQSNAAGLNGGSTQGERQSETQGRDSRHTDMGGDRRDFGGRIEGRQEMVDSPGEITDSSQSILGRKGTEVRTPSLPGISQLLEGVGVDPGISPRHELHSPPTFLDMSNLGGPLSATTLASGSSAGYTSSPGSSGRLSRFSSLGFDPRSSLGSIDSSRSSVSGQHIHAAGAGWWNKDDKARDLSHAGPSSIGRQPSFSRFAFDSERKMETGEGEGIRRASDQIPARTSGLMDGDPLTRYSRFESYPFDSRPAPAIPWHSALPGRRDSSFAAPSTATNSRLSSNATETVAARPYLRSALSAVDPYSEPLITSRPDTSRRLTSPGSDLGMQSRSASDQTTTPALIGSIANAAAIANERERQERRVSLAFGGGKTARGGSAGMPDRNYAGPTHGPYAEEGGGRYASLPSRSYLRPETDDTARLSDAESEPRRVSRTGSFTDIAAERQYAAGEEMRRPSSGPASPVRSHRSEKHLGPRAERPYRPRMQSMMDSSGSITSSSASGSAGPSIFGDYQGRHLPNAFRRDSVIPPDGFRRDSTIPPDGFRRDSAIPPEGFSPVGRGHEDRARRANNLEEPTYPSVLRQEPPRQSISGPSVQSNIPFRSSPRGPMTSQQPTDLAAPTAYMITPIYAHDGGGGPLPASFSPAYATAGTNVPSGSAMRLVTGPPLQADLPSPYSTGPLAMPGSRPGTAFEDSRRENVSGSGPKYTCVHCAKSFNRPSSLKIHIYSHTGEKPYKCNWPGCSRSFSVQSNLKRHSKVHTDTESLYEHHPRHPQDVPPHPGHGASHATGSRRGSFMPGQSREDVEEEEEDELEDDEDIDMDEPESTRA